MSEFCIYLKMPSYLRQWFIHRHGGNDPVTLRRGSIESKMLQRATVPQPPGTFPAKKQEGEVAIQIPYSKSHAPRYYNHITDTGMRALLNCIKDDFDIDVWEYLHDFGKIGRQQKDLIYLFMEQRGSERRSAPTPSSKSPRRAGRPPAARQWRSTKYHTSQ